MNATSYRLPRHTLPIDYDVILNASPKKKTFSGTLVMKAKIVTPTSVVEVNARDMRVSEVHAVRGGKKIAGKARLHKDRETVELRFAKPLPKGPVLIKLAFKGTLNPSMHGLYMAKDGPERAIVSQCEATDARAIFPCFDEPDLKATLRWTVQTDPDMVVITNGALTGRKKARGKKEEVHSFKRTKVIPTYLAAVTIGRFEGTKAKKVTGVPCRIFGGVGKRDQMGFAEEVTSQVLPWYQDYFGQPYNYGKLDQVAVPGFDAGAMENVGAIFYRQNLLLMKPGATSWQGQKRIAEVIAHEIAHQWFGNLVTMKWWDDLWLNEAFATWIAYKSVDAWKPDWRMWDDYLESKESALAADAMVNTHPIYAEVKSPAEATELFDVITYEKGCAVLRMAESYLGADTFRAGIRLYQEAFKNSNAAGADLWGKLSEASKQPVGELMRSWIEQPGFPVLEVDLKSAGGSTEVVLTQRRFYAQGDAPAPKPAKKGKAKASEESTEASSWVVPLVINHDGGGKKAATHRALMRDVSTSVRLPRSSSWAYPNAAGTGFYRMQFSQNALDALLRDGFKYLGPAERTSLLSDQWALMKSGLGHVDAFMDVLSVFQGEEDYAVLRTLVGRLGALHNQLLDDKAADGLADFTRWLVGDQLEELGWAPAGDEGPQRAVRRALIVDALGDIARDESVLKEAFSWVEREMKDPSAVEPNLAGIITHLGALDGDKKRLEQYLKIYTERKARGSAPELSARYMSAFTAFERPDVHARVLAMCLDGTVPQEQLRSVIVPLLHRRATQVATWAFLKKNWKTLAPQVGSMGLARLVESTGSLPAKYRKDVEQFFKKNKVEEAARALQKALEAMDLKQAFIDREQKRLSEWLARAPYKSVSAPSSYTTLTEYWVCCVC